MSNHLKMAIVQAILHLRSLRWSQQRIADELEIDRRTVQRHLARVRIAANAAIPPAGSLSPNAATFSGLPAPECETSGRGADSDPVAGSNAAIPPTGSKGAEGLSKAAISPAGSGSPACIPNATRAGRRSECEPYRELILAKLDQGLSAQRIWQDLVDHGFPAAYDSVKRFVQRLGHEPAAPFRRLESAAGEQAQVDFGSGAPIESAEGKRRKSHVFRVVLSHSRKAYSEATFTQTTEDFIRALENAFAHFGGVPKTLVTDNLKAAVAHPDWFDPELVPKIQSFCQHYGTVILPARPYMARHKGKVESGVKYVKNNALKGRTFTSLEEETRVLQGLVSLGQKHPHGTLEKACETALSYGAFRLKTLRQLLARGAPPQEALPFINEHPIIRPLDDYAQIVARAIHRQASRPSVGEGFTRHGSGVRGAAENEHSPDSANCQSCDASAANSTRPRPGYPSTGCSSAEPASVSPDTSSVVPLFPFHQE
jgi:transposase